MAENLGGISEDVSALIKAINAALPQSNTKKTVDIKVNGAKELKEAANSVQTFGAAVKTLDKSGVDQMTKAVSSITGLLSGKLKNASVSSITTELINVFTKPNASAQQLLTTLLKVQSELEDVQRLSKKIDISLLTSSQLDSLRTRQSKVDSARSELSSRRDTLKREAYQKYEDIDVYQMAWAKKSAKKQTAKEIATDIGIDPDKVTSADAEQLQTYIKTLALLKQLIDARKEYGEIHTSNDAANYLKQEQQISKVFQEVLKQEAAIKEKFKIRGDQAPLSAAFKLDEQTVKADAQKAAQVYVDWFSRTLQTQLDTAIADLDTRVTELQGNIEQRTQRSAQRVEKNTKFARGRGNGGAGGGSGSGTGGTGDGTGVGDGSGAAGSGSGKIGTGVQQAGQAVHKLSEELRKYIVSEDEAIDKIHDLLDAVMQLEEEMGKEGIDPDEYEKKFTEQEEKYKEMLRYRADLIRQGYDSEKYDEEFGIGAWAELDKNTKDIIGGKLRREINDISTYVDSNPITVKVDTKEADEKTQAVKDKVIDLSKDIGERTKIRIFDGVSEEVFDVEKDLDALIAKLDQMALKMEKPVFHAGDLEKDSLSSDSYRPADSLQFVVERHRGDSMGTGTYFASNLGDIIEALHTKSSEGKSGGIYAADLGKYGSSLLQFSGDEEQEAFGEFLRKVTAFVMSIASEDEAFKKQLGSIKVGDTQALFNELKTWFDMFHVNIEDLQAFIDEQVAYVKGFASTSEMSQSKSIGTNFQQKFIRNKGIDITRGVLNDSYALGNLIFDIDKERPFDIAFGNNEDIAAYFYKKVFERILSRKAANPLNYVDDIVDQYIGNSGMPSIEKMGTELTPKLQAIGKAHANDKPESISTLNASLLQKDSTVGIDTSEAQKQIEALKQQVSELQSQLQELSTADKPVVDVDELQAKLERAQEEIDELNHALAGTVSESSNNFLSEQLSEAEQHIRELGEEVASLKQQLADVQQKAQQAPLDMDVLDKKVAELQYLYDKVRTIFDGKDDIINEDMTYDEKFNSAEVQRMIELLSQLSDAELKAAGVMPDDEGSYDSFRQQLQERITLIKEAQDEIQKVIDGQSNEDRNELDLNIASQLEEIYGMAEEVGAKFESRLTPAVREFLSLIEGHVGADEMSNFLGQQNIDRYVDDILSGAKTAKEAFADLENAFGWDTDRFTSLIDGEVPEELKGLYDQLFSDVENRIKSAEQAAEEFNAKLKEIRDSAKSVTQGQTQSPQTQTNDASQQREQEHEAEVKSVEQLIAEYERLGSVLNSIESKYNDGQIPLGEARDTWNEVNENRKAIAEKLTQSGMYYSPDQEKWVQDIINLEDKYKELSALIESGDKKAISEMFKIDESSLGDLEILKNNLKMIIDVLNATDGMSASSAKLSWWNGWLGGGRDLFNTDELTGALKTLGISDDIIEQVAQAHRDAAEAAKQHAAEEQAAADATKNVVDAAGAQKVPGREQPSINPENTGETTDMSALGDAVNSVTKAVDDKTMAFSREAQIVQESVQIELASLQQLVQQLESIRDLSQNLPKIQLSGKDGTKANPIISPELIKSIEQLKTAVGDFDPAKLTALFSSIKNLKINENVSGRMTELATGFTDLRNALDGWEGNAAKTLEMITQLVQKANALKDVIKTANEQNVKQPKAEKAPAQKKEPEKPAQKSQDEIRADQLKAYNAALKEFQALENARVRTGQSVDKLGAETLSKRVQLTNQLDSIQKAWNDDAAKGVAKTKEMLAVEQQRLVNAEEIEAAESKRWNEQVKKSINFSNLQSRTTKLKAEKDLRPDAFGPRYEEIEKKAKELSLLFPLKPFDEDAAQNARDMAEELDKMITETRNAPEYKLAKDNFVSGLGRKMETWAANNGRAIAANKGAWENIQEEFKQIDTLADGQNVSKMFDEFVAGANRAGQAGETFTQGLMKRFKSLGQYLLSFASFYRVIGVFKQVYGTVKELDDALVEMRKVSDESLSSLQKYQSLSFNMADEVGTTAQQIQQSTADWLRLGESFEEAQKSAKESTILLNVSEFDNIDKATEALVSASQAYKDLDKIDIIDKLNNIGNNFSISTDQLATGLQNAAAVLMTQGNDIDEALALLTAGNALPENTVMYLLECI